MGGESQYGKSILEEFPTMRTTTWGVPRVDVITQPGRRQTNVMPLASFIKAKF